MAHKRTEYLSADKAGGKQIVISLSQQLVERYGKNFEQRNLRKMQYTMNKGNILIFQNSNGNIKIDVQLQEETVWLTQ